MEFYPENADDGFNLGSTTGAGPSLMILPTAISSASRALLSAREFDGLHCDGASFHFPSFFLPRHHLLGHLEAHQLHFLRLLLIVLEGGHLVGAQDL